MKKNVNKFLLKYLLFNSYSHGTKRKYIIRKLNLHNDDKKSIFINTHNFTSKMVLFFRAEISPNFLQ